MIFETEIARSKGELLHLLKYFDTCVCSIGKVRQYTNQCTEKSPPTDSWHFKILIYSWRLKCLGSFAFSLAYQNQFIATRCCASTAYVVMQCLSIRVCVCLSVSHVRGFCQNK